MSKDEIVEEEVAGLWEQEQKKVLRGERKGGD